MLTTATSACQIFIFCTTLPMDIWLCPEMLQAPKAHVVCRLSSMSLEASLRAQHKSDVWGEGKKCSLTKGQEWLPLGQRGFGGTLPPAGGTGIVTRKGGRELGVWLWPLQRGGKW